MKALERIKEIDFRHWNKVISPNGVHVKNGEAEVGFLLRAFKVMREIAKTTNQNSGDIYGDYWFDSIDDEFEERMKNVAM